MVQRYEKSIYNPNIYDVFYLSWGRGIRKGAAVLPFLCLVCAYYGGYGMFTRIGLENPTCRLSAVRRLPNYRRASLYPFNSFFILSITSFKESPYTAGFKSPQSLIVSAAAYLTTHPSLFSANFIASFLLSQNSSIGSPSALRTTNHLTMV